MFGEPLYPDCPIPTWTEYDEGYPPYFFDGSEPTQGCCFIIEVEGEAIGQINHDVISGEPKSTELDIWLKSSEYTSKGYGTDAIRTLCNYLNENFNCERFVIAPSRRNIAAVKAYEKVGFKETDDIPADFIPDYPDAVYMVKLVV